jgi:hypothetical protein
MTTSRTAGRATLTSRAAPPSSLTVHVPLKFMVRGGRKTIIGELPKLAHSSPRTRFDCSVAKAFARAYRWKQKLEHGTFATVRELAKAEKINESYVTRLLRLNLLAPEIVEAVLNGRSTLTVESISKPASLVWQEQRIQIQTIRAA